MTPSAIATLIYLFMAACLALVTYLIIDIIRMNRLTDRILREAAKRRHPSYGKACQNCEAPLFACSRLEPDDPCCGRCDHSKVSHAH